MLNTVSCCCFCLYVCSITLKKNVSISCCCCYCCFWAPWMYTERVFQTRCIDKQLCVQMQTTPSFFPPFFLPPSEKKQLLSFRHLHLVLSLSTVYTLPSSKSDKKKRRPELILCFFIATVQNKKAQQACESGLVFFFLSFNCFSR